MEPEINLSFGYGLPTPHHPPGTCDFCGEPVGESPFARACLKCLAPTNSTYARERARVTVSPDWPEKAPQPLSLSQADKFLKSAAYWRRKAAEAARVAEMYLGIAEDLEAEAIAALGRVG